jgi:hypothetical protein
MTTSSIISAARQQFHQTLIERLLRTHDVAATKARGGSVRSASNADDDSAISRRIAFHMARQLGATEGAKVAGQSAGSAFEVAVAEFLQESFLKLHSLRPGKWSVSHVTGRSGLPIAEFEQFAHLKTLDDLIRQDRTIAVLLGNSYSIAPDIVVFRETMSDGEINATNLVVDTTTATRTDLRSANGGKPILHASVSCKWTMRSDRAQNARSEALNLIGNRKGRTPHIAVVVGEPLPSRIASLALGTGEFDCLYHFALYELQNAVMDTDDEEAINLLNDLIAGKRLKDISDLPLDLAL